MDVKAAGYLHFAIPVGTQVSPCAPRTDPSVRY